MNFLFPNAFRATLSVKARVEVPKLFNSENQHSNFCQNIIIRGISKTLLFYRWGIQDAEIKWCICSGLHSHSHIYTRTQGSCLRAFPTLLPYTELNMFIFFLPKKKHLLILLASKTKNVSIVCHFVLENELVNMIMLMLVVITWTIFQSSCKRIKVLSRPNTVQFKFQRE